MREFFRGWRRKAGCVTLVMACALMGGWIRSLAGSDYVEINGRPWRYLAESVIGKIRLVRTPSIAEASLFGFLSTGLKKQAHLKIHKNGTVELNPTIFVATDWRIDWYGFHLSDGVTDRKDLPFRIQTCVIPYWSIVIPMTLLSAYLLLWKPRSKPEPGSVTNA